MSHDALAPGRVRQVEGKEGGIVELEGTPDMVLEVVSDGSEKKDDQTLREAVYGGVELAARGVSVHTLRHCYATHLLEAGVNPRVIQRHMGHASLESTMLYLHLTHKGTEDAYALIDRVMEGL